MEFIRQCTEVRFASFFSGGSITAKVVNPPEGKGQNAPLCNGSKLVRFLTNTFFVNTMTCRQKLGTTLESVSKSCSN